MKNLYECIVIGAGIAGSTAAYHLARCGYNVAILEKSLGPKHKVCGEFLSFEAMRLLEEMGIFLDKDEAAFIKEFQLYSQTCKAGFSFPSPGRGISRYKLDEALLENAENAGADVFRGVSMRDYEKGHQGLFRIETSTDDFYARNLFIATGKQDHSREHKRKGGDDSYIGLKTHLHFKSLHEEFKEKTVLFTFPGGYGGICPVENGRMNFCFVINRNKYKSLNSDFGHTISHLRRSNRQLDLVLAQADFIEPVCAVGFIPYGYIRYPNIHENIYFLGDQRAVIPSFTGDGMAIALSTAKSCVLEFDNRQKGRKPGLEPIQKVLKVQMRWALMAHALLKSSWAVELCMSLPGFNSFMLKTIFQKTRIPDMKENHGPIPKIAESSYPRY